MFEDYFLTGSSNTAPPLSVLGAISSSVHETIEKADTIANSMVIMILFIRLCILGFVLILW